MREEEGKESKKTNLTPDHLKHWPGLSMRKGDEDR